jgi:hypothetical protein
MSVPTNTEETVGRRRREPTKRERESELTWPKKRPTSLEVEANKAII